MRYYQHKKSLPPISSTQYVHNCDEAKPKDDIKNSNTKNKTVQLLNKLNMQ